MRRARALPFLCGHCSRSTPVLDTTETFEMASPPVEMRMREPESCIVRRFCAALKLVGTWVRARVCVCVCVCVCVRYTFREWCVCAYVLRAKRV